MNREPSKITGIRKLERTRHARTPDRTEGRNLDSSMINPTVKKKLHNSRFTMLPQSLNASTLNLRKLELENNNLELELAYSEYVSSCAELILEKKFLKETEETFSKSIKNLYQETKKLQEKCKLFEIKINEIKVLTHLNVNADAILADTKRFNNDIEKYETNNILPELGKLLDRFNVLCCKNVILPNDLEGLQQFKDLLSDCCTVLQSINDPTENDVLNDIALEYEEFLVMHKEIVNIKKIVQEKICNLQTDILKTCSGILLENN